VAIVGIDLGTTNSSIGVYRNGKAELIPNRFGKFLTPSVISLKGDEVIVGETAKEIQAKHPTLSASAFKRFIGTDKVYSLDGRRFSAVDLSALVLKSLVEDAEVHLGEKVEEAVISVPAYFNDKQKKSTIEAAKLVGLKVERLINEPTAASLAYQIHDRKEENVLVIVDLGGGTFDVSVLDIFDDIIEVRAVSGDNHFGGEDFDDSLMRYFASKMERELDSFTKEQLAQIKYTAEQTKKKLSENAHVRVNLAIDGEQHTIEISETKYEEIIMPLIERIRMPLKKAVKDSKFKLEDINEVILVGGSTRMPLVKKHVAKLFNCFPLCHINPDEVVAIGATIAAAMKERNEDFEDTVLTDVCPFTLGTTVLRGHEFGEAMVYDPIIERNMTVPVSRTRRYCTARDNQNKINIDIYQGDSFRINENLKLDEMELSIPRRKKHEVELDVRFTYDVNGILEVEVKVLETGKTEKKIVINANDLSEDDVNSKMALIEHLKIHPRDDEENKNIIAQLERYYEMNLGAIRKEIEIEILGFNAALETQNPDMIKPARARMKQFLEYLEVRS
jgi:molecular chaperone HscC